MGEGHCATDRGGRLDLTLRNGSEDSCIKVERESNLKSHCLTSAGEPKHFPLDFFFLQALEIWSCHIPSVPVHQKGAIMEQ